MTTLLLRLAGPMQSWGTQSRFAYRDTGREPSKSGVIGLIACALGRPRTAKIADIAALQMGVRVDREGDLLEDYHTVGGVSRKSEQGYGVAEFNSSKTTTVISHRYYLADADFLVGLSATTPEQEMTLDRIDAALAAPFWPLFLGRKAFVPGKPIRLPDAEPLGPGRRPGALGDALQTYPWPFGAVSLRFVIEDLDGDELRMDQPLSFASDSRAFLPRRVSVTTISRREDVVLLGKDEDR